MWIAARIITISNAVVGAGVFPGDVIEFDTDVAETRAYVYTYVTAYAEEGQTSPSTVATGDINGFWYIEIPIPPPADLSTNNITTVRLYRTIVDSAGNATYYQVSEFPINPSAVTGYVR